jgi:hypothetical protein
MRERIFFLGRLIVDDTHSAFGRSGDLAYQKTVYFNTKVFEKA